MTNIKTHRVKIRSTPDDLQEQIKRAYEAGKRDGRDELLAKYGQSRMFHAGVEYSGRYIQDTVKGMLADTMNYVQVDRVTHAIYIARVKLGQHIGEMTVYGEDGETSKAGEAEHKG